MRRVRTTVVIAMILGVVDIPRNWRYIRVHDDRFPTDGWPHFIRIHPCGFGMTKELFAKSNETPLPTVLVFHRRPSLHDFVIVKVWVIRLRLLVPLTSATPPLFLGRRSIRESVRLYAATLHFPPLPRPSTTTPDEYKEDERTTKGHQQNLPPL